MQAGLGHDLNADSYKFASEAGNFASRFEVVYSNFLGEGTPTFTANTVVIYLQDGGLVINSGAVVMKGIKMFDISRRLLVEQKAIYAYEIILQVELSNAALLITVTSIEGIVVTKKMVW